MQGRNRAVLDFFRLLWGKLPEDEVGYLTFWFAPSEDSHHADIHALLAADESALDAVLGENEAGEDAYFGLGLRVDDLGLRRQGTWREIVALPGWALDIDIATPGAVKAAAHKAKNLPPDTATAAAILNGSPDPSFVVDSGYGWHAYWIWETPLLLRTEAERAAANQSFRAFQAPFIERAKQLGQQAGVGPDGWHVDKTSTIQRVWRLPYSRNWKGARAA